MFEVPEMAVEVSVLTHTKNTGCSTVSSAVAVKSLKDERTKVINELLLNYEEKSNCLLSKIEENNNKIKKKTSRR